jgi:hypothetical protein
MSSVVVPFSLEAKGDEVAFQGYPSGSGAGFLLGTKPAEAAYATCRLGRHVPQAKMDKGIGHFHNHNDLHSALA